MKMNIVLVGGGALVIISFLSGIGFNKMQTYRRAERLSVLLSARHPSGSKTPSPVNMDTALKQLRAGLARSDLTYHNIRICDSKSFEITLTNSVTIQFQWRGMGEDTLESLRDLTSRLERIRNVVNTIPASSSVKNMDMLQ